MSEIKRISESEFYAILLTQGVPREHNAFKCVRCGHIQSFASLSRHVGAEKALRTAYFSCEGRFGGEKHGCDWTLGGLLKIHKLEVVTENGTVVPAFEPATPEEAHALMLEVEPSLRRCRKCGCTEFRACPGGCYWVEPDLCSACAKPEIVGPRP